jgi:outer membrane protein TolC
MRPLAVILVLAGALRAEVHTLSLREAVELALRQSPDVTLARLDERKAVEGVRLARDPFTPRVYVGSGLAYSQGFPMSIEGSAPSIVQARASQFLFNRPQIFAVSQAKEEARGAALHTAAKRDEAIFRTASLYLDAERAARIRAVAAREVESLLRVRETVDSQVQEGRELPLAAKKAAYNLARARQAASGMAADQEAAETALAQVLGFPADDLVRAAAGERAAPALPASEDDSVRAALEASHELKRLSSQVVARGLEWRGQKAARLPRVDLVAQYGLFARFNNYEDYFRKFQRNNGQVGLSVQIPVLAGPGIEAQAARTQADISRLRIEINAARGRIAGDVRQAWRDLHRAEGAVELARLDLEVAREQIGVHLALLNEGRASLRQVEESRVAETEKWIAFYDAQYAVERARWSVLRHTGDLAAALR